MPELRPVSRAAAKATPQTLRSPVSAGGDSDLDDAPIFLWSGSSSGLSTTPLTPGSPRLPHLSPSKGASTVKVGDTAFRIGAVRFGSGWLIAGESLGQLDRVGSALLAPEILFGVVLLLVVYGGSLAVGLRASAPLEIVQRRQAEFTADASHELRTPLSVIEAEVELALSRSRSPEEYRAVLVRISEESDRLRHIVNELLWLARADDEGTSAQREQRTDVAAGRRDLRRAVPAHCRRARGVLLVDSDGADPYWIEANPAWIDRLLGVLVDNACKYAGTGGYVRVTVRGNNNRVFLQVDDTGPGIPFGQRSIVLTGSTAGQTRPVVSASGWPSPTRWSGPRGDLVGAEFPVGWGTDGGLLEESHRTQGGHRRADRSVRRVASGRQSDESIARDRCGPGLRHRRSPGVTGAAAEFPHEIFFFPTSRPCQVRPVPSMSWRPPTHPYLELQLAVFSVIRWERSQPTPPFSHPSRSFDRFRGGSRCPPIAWASDGEPETADEASTPRPPDHCFCHHYPDRPGDLALCVSGLSRARSVTGHFGDGPHG